MTPAAPPHPPAARVLLRPSVAGVYYIGVHAAAMVAPAAGRIGEGVALALALYVVRNLCLIVGYHRYFAHRSFRTSRAFQFVLGLAGCTAAEKGPLWWAQTHRRHHRESDTPDDIHSPHHQGILYSHSGWFLDPRYRRTDPAQVPDLSRFPELRFLDRWNGFVQLALAATLAAVGGWHALLWGYAVSTVLVWHSTHVIQSVAHLWGRRDYPTRDESRNSLLLGLLILGDGWHNNHHYYPASARHGFAWWEPDPAYWVIRGLALAGLVWDVRTPPPQVLRARGQGMTRPPGLPAGAAAPTAPDHRPTEAPP